MANNDSISFQKTHRDCLSSVVASLCIEAGYESAEKTVLETLSEMLQSYITEISHTTKVFCEHAGRTLPNGQDVKCAFADIGFYSGQLLNYVNRARQINLGQVSCTLDATTAPVLQVGKRKNFPPYIPETFTFPSLPDPHAYIRTTTGQKATSDYVVLRECLSEQRRDVERALTRFVAKTGKSYPLYPHDEHAFPLIAAEANSLSYLAALLPSEHEAINECVEQHGTKESDNENSSHDQKSKNTSSNENVPAVAGQKRQSEEFKNESSNVIHNPFLRPVKKQRLKKKQ